MPGYMVVMYRKTADAETMRAYGALAVPAMQAYGGRFLVRAATGTVEPREAGSMERVVVIEFPSKQQAIYAYDSDEYHHAMRLLQGKAERDIRFVNGYETPSL